MSSLKAIADVLIARGLFAVPKETAGRSQAYILNCSLEVSWNKTLNKNASSILLKCWTFVLTCSLANLKPILPRQNGPYLFMFDFFATAESSDYGQSQTKQQSINGWALIMNPARTNKFYRVLWHLAVVVFHTTCRQGEFKMSLLVTDPKLFKSLLSYLS